MKHRMAIAAALAITLSAAAQYNETNNLFYHAFRTPQSTDLNPAFFPNRNTVYLRLPGIGMQFGSPVSISDMAYVEGDTATIIDVTNILDALTDNNRIRFGADIDLFGFGFKVRNLFFNFNSPVYSLFCFLFCNNFSLNRTLKSI